MERFWLKHYPPGVPADVNVAQYRSLPELLEDSFRKYADRDAFVFMDHALTYAELDRLSAAFGAWLQSTGLPRGARVAIMMPNILQYPVALAGALRAGYVVVNVNPLYTPRELEHQMKDSGAAAIVILENFAATLQQVIGRTSIRHVIVTSLGELLGFPKGAVVNFAVRRVKHMVPPYSLPGHLRFHDVLEQGRSRALEPADAGPGRHRVPAVHRRHDGRRQGRGAAAPQPHRQPDAVRGVVRAGAARHEPRTRARAVRLRLRPAALSRVRAGGQLPVRHPARRGQRADRQSARHPPAGRRTCAATRSTCCPPSTRC